VKRTPGLYQIDQRIELSCRNTTEHRNALRYAIAMIKSFRSRETENIWNGARSKRLPQNIQQIARRKLRMLNNARSVNDLRVSPANRLEALRGNRKGQHGIRISDQ
jgi:proteic killer suppression protein